MLNFKNAGTVLTEKQILPKLQQKTTWPLWSTDWRGLGTRLHVTMLIRPQTPPPPYQGEGPGDMWQCWLDPRPLLCPILRGGAWGQGYMWQCWLDQYFQKCKNLVTFCSFNLTRLWKTWRHSCFSPRYIWNILCNSLHAYIVATTWRDVLPPLLWPLI